MPLAVWFVPIFLPFFFLLRSRDDSPVFVRTGAGPRQRADDGMVQRLWPEDGRVDKKDAREKENEGWLCCHGFLMTDGGRG